jgi:hypothetical protein
MTRKTTAGRAVEYRNNFRDLLRVFSETGAEIVGPALTWYDRQHAGLSAIARELDVDIGRTIQAAAVLSPSTSWAGLIRRLPRFIIDATSECGGYPSFPAYGRARRAAVRILSGETTLGHETRGPKVRAFGEALMLRGLTSDVTVDRHMLSLARGLPIGRPQSCTLTEYREVELAVQAITAELPDLIPAVGQFGSVYPAQCQALIWVLSVGEGGRIA